MASIIKIKRSGTTAAPSALGSGELAYSWENSTGGKLFIGWGNENGEGEAQNISAIGGLYYTDLVTDRISHSLGTLTANAAIIVDGDSKIDLLKIDDIVIDSNSISTAVANTNLVFVAGADKSIDVSSAKIINLGTPTANTDAVTKIYVDSAIEGLQSSSEFDYAADIGSGSFNLSTEVFSLLGGTGISTTANSATDAIVISLDNTGVVANTYGSSTEIPVLTINEQGQITLANTASISTDLSISGDIGTDTISLIDDTLNFAGGTGVTTTVTDSSIEFSIGQDVSTTANVTFESVVANTSIEAGGILISGNTISTTSNTAIILDATFISVSDTSIRDVADPETASDAANKRYVDEVAQGLKARQAAWVLSDTNLSANYDPDGYEIGWATLTSTSNGAFPDIDGVLSATLNVVGARLLVIGQTNEAHNGLYVVSTVGDISNPWILRRCGSCRTSEQIPSSFVFIQQGTIYESTGWVAIVDNVDTFVVGVDDITWTQFSGAGTFIAGNGLDLSGNVFSVNVDGTSIEIVADTLQVANNGITNAMLAGSIENDKLVNSSITFAANTGTSDDVLLGETIIFGGNTGVTTTVSNNQIIISGTLATDTNVGVASFSNTDFIVTSGLVEIQPELIQDTVADFIIGGQSITTSYDDANNALIISSELATLTNIGVASFGGYTDSGNTVRQFSVTGGDVSIAAIDGGSF